MISTFSLFYYGPSITRTNYRLDFNEGAADLVAEVGYGNWTPTEFAQAVEDALNEAGSGTIVYTVTFSRSTRKLTISGVGGNFELLITSGDNASRSPFAVMGYSGADVTGAATYTAGAVCGSVYTPQFKLQDYIGPEDWKEQIQSVINETITGRYEQISYGTKRLIQMNIGLITNITQDGTVIKTNATGVADAEAFLLFLSKKGKVEFIPDIAVVATFYNVVAEGLPGYSTATGYKLQELYARGLTGYFETGVMRMRVIE